MATLGPDHGQLTLHTTRAGVASRVGHDLTIEVANWSAEVTMTDAAPTAVTLTASLPSMVVTKGEGGLKPLSDSDRETIVKNALKTLSAKQFPDITFVSSAITATGSGFSIDGALSIAGQTKSETVPVETATGAAGTTLDATVVVSQHAFGVSPYSAMLGALKVADPVTVTLHLVVPNGI